MCNRLLQRWVLQEPGQSCLPLCGSPHSVSSSLRGLMGRCVEGASATPSYSHYCVCRIFGLTFWKKHFLVHFSKIPLVKAPSMLLAQAGCFTAPNRLLRPDRTHGQTLCEATEVNADIFRLGHGLLQCLFATENHWIGILQCNWKIIVFLTLS